MPGEAVVGQRLATPPGTSFRLILMKEYSSAAFFQPWRPGWRGAVSTLSETPRAEDFSHSKYVIEDKYTIINGRVRHAGERTRTVVECSSPGCEDARHRTSQCTSHTQ
ncbi:hypothetical protein E2C01_063429 [Portunus trituberculatus]|uniref:Uncharacterized protein n=1 Tax=Portunus trituberculatus TaxID=210409 RepID=A0A5B7HGC2_PORTR|nr:hypothetical protein [Portunus trituberculatus]